MTTTTPYVAFAVDECPWADLDLSCPNCGGDPLPLRDSDPPGLTYIKCDRCEGVFLRGEPDLAAIFGRGKTREATR